MSRYARFFPPELRATPVSETWRWGDIDVRIRRAREEHAPISCLVLHGAGGNSELLAPLLVALAAEGFEGVAPDLPGYGETSIPRHRFRYQTWVECVADLARREADRTGRPVAVFGASIGGMLGYHAAAARPELFAGVAATNLLEPRDRRVRSGVARAPWLGRATGLISRPLDDLCVPIRWLCKMSAIANDPELVRACASDPRGGGSRVPLGFLRSWFGYRPAVEPERFTAPVLLAHPGADRWTPPQLSLPFFERLAGPKRYVTLENCGHAPVEQPGLRQLREALGGFLGELAGAGSGAPA